MSFPLVQVAGLEVISSGAPQESSADLSLDQEGLIPVTKATKLTTTTTLSPLPRNDSNGKIYKKDRLRCSDINVDVLFLNFGNTLTYNSS